jgi:hypothetical protein
MIHQQDRCEEKGSYVHRPEENGNLGWDEFQKKLVILKRMISMMENLLQLPT